MKFRNTRRSTNVRDARTGGSTRSRGGSRGKAVGGAGGMGIIGLLLFLFFGIGGDGGLTLDTVPSLDGGGGGFNSPAAVDETTFDTTQEQFMQAVIVDLEDFWQDTFTDFGLQYNDATFTFYDTPIRTGCGSATAAIGPHYCPLDNGVYLELGFFDQLASRFGATGDAAQAYVVGHEYAHHVQNEIGISTEVRQLQGRYPNERNQLSVKLELQADCLAGVWMGSLALRNSEVDFDNEGEVREALNAAAAVGDDRIQEATQGYTDPHSWTHGSAQQRYDWFLLGYENIDTEVCDTFGDA